MTPEDLREKRVEEAVRQAGLAYRRDLDVWDKLVATIAIDLEREGWTPPEPVDPDVLAVRELLAGLFPEIQNAMRSGAWDDSFHVRNALAAYRAGREAEKAARARLEPKA